jgi:hypothetical protein
MPKKAQAQVIAPPADRGWLGQSIAAVVAGLVILAAIAYLSGAVGDAALGVVLAAGVALLSAGRVAVVMLERAGSSVARAGIVASCLAMLALSVLPVALTIMPGRPVATGSLEQVGDTMELPQAVSGSVRLLVHGGINAQGDATVEFELAGAQSPIEGKLERSVSTSRVGRRGVAHEQHERNSEFVDATVAADQHTLKLERVEGPLAGALGLTVYRDHFPLVVDIAAGLLVLALVALMGARLEVGTDTIVAGGVALAFGAVGHEFVTPGAVIRPLIGAAIMALVIGGAAGGIFAALAKRFVQRFERGGEGSRERGRA